MSTAFADTSFYIALLTRTDSRHKRAAEITNAHQGRIVTTEWVMLELGSYFSPISSRPAFLMLMAALREAPDVLITPANSLGFTAGLTLFSERLDKAWSVVDCISFLTMREHGITDSWTTDHHFEQAGFKALLI